MLPSSCLSILLSPCQGCHPVALRSLLGLLPLEPGPAGSQQGFFLLLTPSLTALSCRREKR